MKLQRRSILGWLASAALGVAAAAEPPEAVLRDAVARGVLDAEVAAALEETGRVRALAAFAVEPGASPSARPDAARVRLLGMGFYPGRRFERIPILFGSFDPASMALLLEDPHLRRVSLETTVLPQLAEAVPLVSLDQMHDAGHVGAGAKVAVIDTGVDLAHADLAGAVIAEQCYCDDAAGPAGCCPNGFDQQSGAGAAQDAHGHGTRVAGIVTSAGVHAPLGGAPDAQIVVVKVTGSTGGGSLVDLLSAMEWVLMNHPDSDVLNLSLGFGLYTSDCDDADASTIGFASAVDQLKAAGVLTVAGTGNNGSGTGIIAPACLSNAFAVGAVWDADVGSRTHFGCTDATTAADQVTCWSNSNASTDVMAPGAPMTSSRLGGTSITLVGTSYATPVVSACAAVLALAHPSAAPDALADALRSSPVSVVDAKNGLSFPRLDCFAAHSSFAPGVPVSIGPTLLVLVVLLGGLGAAFVGFRRASEA